MNYDCNGTTRSIYIHWPFCPYKCHFCPFVALAGHDDYMEQYHYALVQEIKQFGKQVGKKLPLDTIYFGGGTPSTYPPELLLDMFGILKNVFAYNDATEVTLEVNPGTVTQEKLAVWQQAGINRLSIGVQGLDDAVLHGLNRKQKASDVQWLLAHASPLFDNLSIDLIVGLPGISVDAWQKTVRTVMTWPITHLSMYFLMVHESTPLYYKVKSRAVRIPCDDTTVEQYHWAREEFARHGFMQYEISNFARAGYASKHNVVYWDRKPYKAFGIGACSFDGTYRFGNTKNLMEYMQGIQNSTDVTAFAESLTTEQIRLERVMLGLRRPEGIPWQVVVDGITDMQLEQVTKQVRLLQKRALLKEHAGRLMLTPAGLAVENDIVTRLAL